MDGGKLITAGIALMVLGFLTVLAGSILSTKPSQTEVRGGGVVFIGPVPLIFGTDKNSAILVSLTAIALMLLFYLIFLRR